MPPAAGPNMSAGKARTGRMRIFSTDQAHSIKKALKKAKSGPLSFLQCNMDGDKENIQYVKRLVEEKTPSMLLLTNTHMDTKTPRAEQAWPFYRPIFCDNENSEGGMAIYLLDSLQFELIPELNNGRFQAVWLKVIQKDYLTSPDNMKEDKVIVFGNVYADSRDNEAFLTYLDDSLLWLQASLPGTQIILQGCIRAFNQEWLQGDTPTNEDGELLRNVAVRNNLRARSRVPTWFPGRRSKGDCTDLFLTSETLTTNVCGPLDFIGSSDHKAVFAQLEPTFCTICRIGYKTNQEMRVHQDGSRHFVKYCLVIYLRNRDKYLLPDHELGLSRSLAMSEGSAPVMEANVLQMLASVNQTLAFKIVLQNSRPSRAESKGIVVEAIQLLLPDRVFTLQDEQNITDQSRNSVPTKIRLKYNVPYTVNVMCRCEQVGQHKGIIMISFYHEELSVKEGARHTLSHMAIEFLFKIHTKEMEDLKPKAPYQRPKPYVRWAVSETVRGVPLEKRTAVQELARSRQLWTYTIPASRQQIIQENFTVTDKSNTELKKEILKCNKLLTQPLDENNYAAKFDLLLHCEESQLEFDIHHYDMQGVTLKKERNGKFRLCVPGLMENRPSVLKGDKLLIKQTGQTRQYEAHVHETESNDCLLGIAPAFSQMFVNNMKFEVRFTLNRLCLRVMHRAVELAQQLKIVQCLFPTEEDLSPEPARELDVRCFDRQIESNPAQLQAVKNIVSGTSGSAPYIIFGPPGTGKTVTMVEAIKQVVKLVPGARVVAAAPSNSAADLLAKRLIGHIGKGKLLRMHAQSRHMRTIPQELLPFSNIAQDDFYYPPVDQLQTYSVIVVTLFSAGRLVTADFPLDHFTHIFVDECGHAEEPQSCVALAGLVSLERLQQDRAQVVLAGDPRQLGPILRSPHALRHRLHISLLERLMELPLYSSPYNPACITKLVRNFRSHEKLLELPSRLYYDGELVPAADPILVNSMLHFEGLPDRARGKFPLIFHGVVGQDEREEKSPSYFNAAEVIHVLDYVKMVLTMKKNPIKAQEIGVISPYRRQVQKIREKLGSHGYKDVTVGSTEEFQGQERRVIIISCVRSSPEHLKMDEQYKLGFLRNPKRFNVAITRAKALLVVIGNPHILGQDYDWRQLITYAQGNGGYTGCSYHISSDHEMDSLMSRLNDLMIKDAAEDFSPQTLYEEPAWMGDH